MIRLAQLSIRIDDSPSPTPNKIGFNPILSYIEGYAYNSKKEIIPKAQILVKIKNGNQLFYKTTADENGFFKVYADNLPFLEYYLEIIDPKTKESFSQTTVDFVKLNKDYLDKQKLDLIRSTKDNKPIINPETKEKNRVFNQNSSLVPTSITTKTTPSVNLKNKNQLMILFLILIFLFLILGLLFYYFFQKNKLKI